MACDRVIVVGRRDEACARALDFSRATHAINNKKQSVPDAVREIVPAGVTHAVEAIGENSVLQDCLDSLSADGKVGVYGVPPRSQGKSALLADPRIASAEPCEALARNEVMVQIIKENVPGRGFVSHEIDFTECAKGFELLESREAFKVGLNFGE